MTHSEQSPKDQPHKTQHPHANTTHQAHEVKTLLSWSAPSRIYRKREKQYYVNVLLIVLALEVILFLFSQYMLMLVILSLTFLAFALAVTPPSNIYYRISTEGITIEDHYYLWQELYDFYFKKRYNHETLHIRTKAYLPGELVLLLGDVQADHMQRVLLPYLPYREVVVNTFTDKAGDFIARSFPLDNTSHK